jgi:hypothetical protein
MSAEGQEALVVTLARRIAELVKSLPCSSCGTGNEPCRLNESEDLHEICLPHLADAVLSRPDELTQNERERLGMPR